MKYLMGIMLLLCVGCASKINWDDAFKFPIQFCPEPHVKDCPVPEPIELEPVLEIVEPSGQWKFWDIQWD